MRVYVCDAVGGKTTKHWIKWLGENHELVVDQYFNPVYAEWADIIYIEWCETPAIEASRLKAHYDGVYDHMGVRGEREKQHSGDFDWSGKQIYIRAIDIDVYYGHYGSVQWENITGLIYIAKHIYGKMSYPWPEKLRFAHIPLSIDVEAWKFQERDGSGRNIAWVNHHWSAKGMPLMLQALHRLVEVTGDKTWKLHVVENGRSTEWWLFDYLNHMIKALGLEDNVVWHHDPVPNVDEFLDGMDYAVTSSHKEAFSLFSAEALAKGIKTLIHNWWGAEDVWPKELVWTSIEDFANKMWTGKYDSKHFREVASQYDKSVEIQKLREFLGL